MIVRLWNARTTAENEPLYRRHLEEAVFPTMRSIDGFIDAHLLERALDGEVELLVESRWESMATVRRFAGDTFERAVVTPTAKSLLTSFDDTVSHYEIKARALP